MGDGGVVLDPNSNVASDAEEGRDIGEGHTLRPVMDLGNLRIIRDVAFIIAFVSEDGDFLG